MKTRFNTRSSHRPLTVARLLLPLWGCLAAVSSVPASADPVIPPAGSFVEGLRINGTNAFQSVDTIVGVDGVTYLLGRSGASDGALKKYDASGTALAWDPVPSDPSGTAFLERIITGLTGSALALEPGSTNLYAAGGGKIVRVSTATGAATATLSTAAPLSLKSIFFWNGHLYGCGTLNSAAHTLVYGITAHARGNKAGVLVRYKADLSAAEALITFGGGSGDNTAESLVVDENGDLYVSGHLASGTLTSDAVSEIGKWQVEMYRSTGPIPNLAAADTVMQNFTPTTTYYNILNFGDGSSGLYGADAAFPGGSGDHFVLHATGQMWAQTDGNYIFWSDTDDGTRLLVDGNQVLSFPGLRGAALSASAPIHLTPGLHSIDYVMFENEGAASAELLYIPPAGVVSWLSPAGAGDTQNKAYVLKFSGDFTAMTKGYFTVAQGAGSGGSFHELHYAQGWVYAAGSWKGTANNPAVGQNDASADGLLDGELVKLDTNLRLKARATIKGTADNEAYSITSDDDGNVYVTGSYGAGSMDFVGSSDRNAQSAAQDGSFASRSSAKPSVFVAKLDPSLSYLWIDQPTVVPDSFPVTLPSRVRWHAALQRLFWTGYFVNGALTMGEPSTIKTLSGSQGFLAVLDPDGRFTERVNLSIISQYGTGGTQIKPFGGPALGTNNVATLTNTHPVIKGVAITASVPKYLYRDLSNNDITDDTVQNATLIDTKAETRIRAVGYSVDDNVVTGSAESYSFTITKDTTVTFNWAVEHALTIQADFSATTGTGDPTHGLPGIAGISSEASGNPVPAVKKNWIAKDESVIATIDAEVLDQNNPGLPVKFVVTGYEAFGPPNSLDPAQTNFFAFVGNELRRQVPQFFMDGPAKIKYHWKLKIGVQVNTTGFKSSALPLVHVMRDPGLNTPPTQADGPGTGTFYFDEHTYLEIGTMQNKDLQQVKGWLNGDGFVFPSDGSFSNLTSHYYAYDVVLGKNPQSGDGLSLDGVSLVWTNSTNAVLGPRLIRLGATLGESSGNLYATLTNYFQSTPPSGGLPQPRAKALQNGVRFFTPVQTVVVAGGWTAAASTLAGVRYASQRVVDLIRPGRVMWDYGDRIFQETVNIGNSVTFNTVDDPAIRAVLRADFPPDHMDISQGPPGSTSDDMGVWDDKGKKFYPLRPGTLLSYWKTTVDPNDFVIVRLIQQYPAAPHYRHIANTPPVKLDPATNDLVTFQKLKYAETTTGAAVDSSGMFTATGPGKTVLLFSELSSSGRGGQIQTLRVRVVETHYWSDQLPATQDATIGQKITSSYDTAGLNTGFLFFPNVRYNASVYDRQKIQGPIIPVNLYPSAGPTEQMVVVWYEMRDKILWPYQAARYNPVWPTAATGLNRIVIASRFGSDCVASNGTDQFITPEKVAGTNVIPAEVSLDPIRFQQVQVYNQPNRTLPGYNPNEEHALLAPSLRYASVSPRPQAVYALRDSDLNVTNKDATYTSDPYVLVQFFDSLDNEFKMKVFAVMRAATNLSLGELSYKYSFEEEMAAGEPVIPFYPLPSVIGATPGPGTYGREGDPNHRKTFWKDHKGTGWAISGDGYFYMYFYYPLLPDFWWPAQDHKNPGDFVAWLPDTPGFTNAFFAIDYNQPNQTPPAQRITYTTTWPQNLPILKVGETLTFSGGEYRADNPVTYVATDTGDVVAAETPGLPGAVGWAAGEVVFDSLNPTMDDQAIYDHYTARLFQALEERAVNLPSSSFPAQLLPANRRTKVVNGRYVFTELPSSLQKRLFYDPLTGKLGLKGFLNEKDIANPTLTASPSAVYVLEPDILTTREQQLVNGTAGDSPYNNLGSSDWTAAVNALYKLCRNPNTVSRTGDTADATPYRVGLERKIDRLANGQPKNAFTNGVTVPLRLANKAVSSQALGPGLAIVANPAFLDPTDTNGPISYVTLAENNQDSLGGAPVVLHIIKVDKTQRYRGSIKTILSDNVFDENIVLRHTGDFGANADDLVFEWWYRPEDGADADTPDRAVSPNPWKLFGDPSGKQGQSFYQLVLKGNPSAPEVLLADTLFYVRYRHVKDSHDGVKWEVPQPNGAKHCVLSDCVPGIPYEWAGAGNSSPQDLNQDGKPDYRPQLAQGWVKRVLDAVNPYEARIRDFSGDNPATYVSMIRQFGARFEGPVALNPDKNVIENVGLIELYHTIFDRAKSLSIDLSTPISTPAIATALQLASTRLADFYQLLGNEAYDDAQNPTIGFGSELNNDLSGAYPGYGAMFSAVFCFENQVSSLLEEELALLRGQDDYKGRPVYNRLFWNFTKGEGEAAYAQNYSITDVNNDGFIDEYDAQILYPQGHGDAWGHYLTAMKFHYDLLRHPYFNWVSRSEFYNLQDIVLSVDFLDERKFAQVAAEKAKAGVEIVNSTYRQAYVADPDGQWQGYSDTDQNRAWGVEEWAHRAGQGAYFDWVTANALLPAVHPNTNYTGIQKIDRTTVQDLAAIAANLTAVQTKLDEANGGNNPLGLAEGALVFDIDPTFLEVGSTAQIGTRAVQGLLHFDQIFERALQAVKNARAAFNNANQLGNMLRAVVNSETDYRNQVFEQDMSYRNQLIEIFGTPYAGTIGSGQAYPPGYQGPDTALYMYVNVREVNSSTVPQITVAFTNGVISDATGSDSHFLDVDNSVRQQLSPAFAGTGASDMLSNLMGNTTVDYTTASSPQLQMQNIRFPIQASGYTFQAPDSWGSRASPGELQSLITDMVVAEADLNEAFSDMDSLQAQIQRQVNLINARYQLMNDVVLVSGITIGLNTVDFVVQEIAKSVSESLEASGYVIKAAGDGAAESIPKNTPTGGLSVSPGDALAPLRGGLEIVANSLEGVDKFLKLAFDKIAAAAEYQRDVNDKLLDIDKTLLEGDYEIKTQLSDLEGMIGNVSTKRVEVFKRMQALRGLSDQYRSKLAAGFRLIQERIAFNKRVGAKIQQARYQDMSFRVSRNAALEKYRSSFDLAARYTYLTATTYDYDTNLDKNDPGSPIDILAEIVRQRSLGLLTDDGQPAMGAGGLADNLAWLKSNYDVLKNRMGLNNPQIETVSFSLRKENFRTLAGLVSDSTWRTTLNSAAVRKADLWQVPEFRRYCRPFASATNGPQPGLVIGFGTQIRPNKNFFGWPLGGGDNTYDPSVYATKINAVGMWFEGYDTSALPQTPRVYLVPVGQDVMTVPTSPDLEVRLWNVLDQSIPVPYPSTSSQLNDPTWKPLTDSLSGILGETRKFSSFRAFGFSASDLSSAAALGQNVEDGVTLNARLVGRSAWNTRWMLIIPGETLNADPTVGLDTFVNSVTDIHLIISTYGCSGN